MILKFNIFFIVIVIVFVVNGKEIRVNVPSVAIISDNETLDRALFSF